MDMKDVLAVILSGGEGQRLYPLTKERAKPAVPLAGKYRLIDVPMSNCIHAGIDKIAIITQFNSASLHRHIFGTYHRDVFTKGWIQIWPAKQTPLISSWFQGSADAVRKQMSEIVGCGAKFVIILAGDHLYRMDYKDFLEAHADTASDVTVAVQPVNAVLAPGLGILKLGAGAQITDFHEKPKGDETLEKLKSNWDPDRPFMASMGIYIFSTNVLAKALDEAGDDFGQHVIPWAVKSCQVKGYVFNGYWEDIGTIHRFYEVNLEMTKPNAPFDFHDPERPIYTHPRFLPTSEIRGAEMHNVLLSDGCILADADVRDSVIGLRSVIGSKAVIHSSIVMGADFYETEKHRKANVELGRPDVGIGDGSVIKRAIIDKNARIGKNVIIRAIPKRPNAETDTWVARDGIVVVMKNAIIPDEIVI